MGANGNYRYAPDEDADEGAHLQSLLYGARSVDDLIPVLAKAADAILVAGRALASMARDLGKIGTGTARAISDTVELKRHLKAITEREQVLRRELDAVKSQLKPVGKRAKAKKKRRRK